VNGAVIISDRQLGPSLMIKGAVPIVAQLAATVALLAWLGPVPTQGLAATLQTRQWRLTLAIAITVVAFFAARAAGVIVLVPIGIAAAVIVAILRPRPSIRELGLALALGLLATAGGVVEWLASGRTSDLAVALAQLPLVIVSLLAGWAIADYVGWVPLRIGATAFLIAGAARALRDFGIGFLLAGPWALGNVATCPFEEDNVRAGWQALAALHPGVAEEARTRVSSSRCSTGSFAGSHALARGLWRSYWWTRTGLLPACVTEPGRCLAPRQHPGAAHDVSVAEARLGDRDRIPFLRGSCSVSGGLYGLPGNLI
jgi:hypothetical protein